MIAQPVQTELKTELKLVWIAEDLVQRVLHIHIDGKWVVQPLVKLAVLVLRQVYV